MADYTDDIEDRLQTLLNANKNHYDHFLGFPAALDFKTKALGKLQHRYLNNIGDPLVSTWHTMHTKEFEQEVLQFFADLFRAEPQSWWGYVTSGSTECNLFALYVGREKFPEAKVYYSRAAHYSVPKNIHILGQKGVVVKATPTGVMDYADLTRQLQADKATQAIVLATIGTTMTEAKDDVTKIRQALQDAGVKESFIHSDAALAGPYTAVLEPRHPFDFADGADSVGISGYKFIGAPAPCGVVLVHKSDKDLLNAQANYTGSVDSTISGSRSGHTPLYLWYALQKWGRTGLKQRAEQSLDVAAYTHNELKKMNWPTWRNSNALTVMLAAPPMNLITKWQLATQDDWSHIICMPGITKEKIDHFMADLTACTLPKPFNNYALPL